MLIDPPPTIFTILTPPPSSKNLLCKLFPFFRNYVSSHLLPLKRCILFSYNWGWPKKSFNLGISFYKLIETCNHNNFKKHLTPDMLKMRGGFTILSKCQLPSSYSLSLMMFWRFEGKGSPTESVNQWVTKVFVEQPWQHRVC